jgi:outer membrane protein TolC
MKILKIVFVFVLCLLVSQANAQKTFTNLNELVEYATQKSIGLQQGDIRMIQAQKAKIAAVLGVFDLQWQNSMSFVNNVRLPVSVLPSEALGGEPGTTTELQTGTQYTTNIAQTADIKLLNVEGWKNLKLASLNLSITENDKKLTMKTLYENIAISYYNIVQLQAQLNTTQQNIAVADTLLQIIEDKYKAGIVKQQDVNDSRVNLLNIQKNAREIEYLITQNYLSLKILADIPHAEDIVIAENLNENQTLSKPSILFNDLEFRNKLLNENYALENLRKNKWSRMPTVSFIANNSYNQYNQNYTVTGGNWINSQYMGLKLNLPFPTATNIANQSKARYDYQLSQKNTIQTKIKAELQLKQLDNDWQKAYAKVSMHKQIADLQRDTYQKNKNLYNEGLQSLDRTINSFNTLVNAHYDFIASQVSVLVAESKITINNKIK